MSRSAPGSTLTGLSDFGLSVGTTNATNLLTQGKAAAGQTLTFTVGAQPGAFHHFWHRRPPQCGYLGGFADALAALLALYGTATVDATGNITVTAASATDTITVGGTATANNFGIQTNTALPSNGTVVAQDQYRLPQRVAIGRRGHGL